MASAFREGFICPECQHEFSSVDELLVHDQTRHSREEPNKVKGLFDFAKSKQELNRREELIARTVAKYFDITEVEVTPLGPTRSHFDYFKKQRAEQVERLSSEASKLLIRLHKLISFEGEENKRRGFEQNIVHWIGEKHVSRCPDCAESFNLLLRKHHCRLCGSILCDKCSMFITADLATSLTSQFPKTNTLPIEFQLRSCMYCFHLVKMKGSPIDNNPLIVRQYQKLRELITNCEMLSTNYTSVVSNFNTGNNSYSMEEVTSLRNDLILHTDKIDLMSKNIVVSGNDPNEFITESEKMLRSRLRISTVNWIREFLNGLSIPHQKQVLGDSWMPSCNSSTSDDNIDFMEEDVIEIQIRQVKKFLREAKNAGLVDEVKSLEANLKSLLDVKKQHSS